MSRLVAALSAIVLAGGRSSRLGQDKALLVLGGRPLIQHIVARLQAFSDDVLVVTGPTVRYRQWLDVPLFADEVQERGPIGGLYTGLKHARYEYSLVAACDMPFISHAVVELLRAELNGSVWAVVPEVAGHRIPTLAIYHKRCLEVIERLLDHHTSLQALLDAIPIRVISEAQIRAVDPDLRSFTNINTLTDWKRAMLLSL